MNPSARWLSTLRELNPQLHIDDMNGDQAHVLIDGYFDLNEVLAQSPAPMRVKPLVWEAHPYSQSTNNECAISDAPFSHRYQAQRDPWASTYMAFLHPNLPITDSTLWWESKGHPTLEAARAAAQADYSARILAALEAPDAGVVAELMEAAKAMLARWPTDQHLASPLYDEAQALRAAITKLETRA